MTRSAGASDRTVGDREGHATQGASTEIATCASPSRPSPPPSAATKNNSADYAVTTSAPTGEFPPPPNATEATPD